jgi:hypothetical protein
MALLIFHASLGFVRDGHIHDYWNVAPAHSMFFYPQFLNQECNVLVQGIKLELVN